MNKSRTARSSLDIAVIGAGAWGTALAAMAARQEQTVCLWAFEHDVAEAINRHHENHLFLPGMILPAALHATADPRQIAGAALILLAVPAQHMRTVLRHMYVHLSAKVPLVICAKGIEQQSGALMSEVVSEIAPGHPIAILSGPSFAREVALGLPTALTLATQDKEAEEVILRMLGTPTFRLYASDDVIGAQIGGAIKNILAIACGIVDGKKLGENARAAVITRGFAEMTRLGLAMGARTETLTGLSGLGDLVLTCTSRSSRNMALGAALGEGQSLAQLSAQRLSVAEGVFSAAAVVLLAERHKVEMPIAHAVAEIVAGRLAVDEAIAGLLSRPRRRENDF
jgi:glycerol-3-phosphate dehydrogenase (NAD(P)+)